MGSICSRGETVILQSGMDVSNKVAIITGGAKGLGRSFSQKLLSHGAKVCIADVDTETGKATVAELQSEHGDDNVMFCKCDVTQDADFKGAWDATVEKLGPVNILINNAGIGNEQNWKLTFDVNLGGCIRGTLLGLERMGVNKGGSGGAIINVASIAGLKGNPFGPVYSTTKHGIVGLTRSLGHDFHYNICKVTVQALCPSLVKTDLLTDSAKNAFSPEVSAAMMKLAGSLPDMTAEFVAEALLKLLTEGRNGGCMAVVAEKEPFYVDAPIPS